MGASYGGEPPIGILEAAALEDEATIFAFGAISIVKILEKICKKLKAFGILKKA